MAPARQKEREPSIERSEEYEEFMQKLEDYHEKRGTTLEREPKVGPRHLDLLRLYTRVTEEGGYDKVSDTKNNKLAWRKIASEFLPQNSNLPSWAFLVKSAYYKNLAAYEISNFHHREPPPKEILEDVTARGGDLLTRTTENFIAPTNRETGNLAGGQGNEDSDEGEQKTPKEEKVDRMDIDEPGSTGRATRGLRQAPPQRIIFQPDTSASRQSRHAAMNQVRSPAPGMPQSYPIMNGTPSSGSTSLSLANYEPRQPIPATVKPVMTPGNNPEFFRGQRARMRDTLAFRISKTSQQSKGMMLPGTGFPGPNIYIRALLSLQSGIPEEEEYALHHLVKISHERGDKYRFDGFPGLANALVQKVLQVTKLFYGVKCEVSYRDEEAETLDEGYINGLTASNDLVERFLSKYKLLFSDEVYSAHFSEELGRINEAGLVLRNMVMLEENAEYLSRLSIVRDLIVITLNLPPLPAVVELQHYSLEIAEQLTKYYTLETDDPLYTALLEQLNSTDRGAIVTSLRALGRIAMNRDESNRLKGVPVSALRHICDWMLVDDEELRNACLDFLYQYTTSIDNIELLLDNTDVSALVGQLVRLLLHDAKVEEKKERTRHSTRADEPMSAVIPKLPQELIEQLLLFSEPERSFQWLRVCFEEEPNGEITQLSLWQAYQGAFAEFQQQRPLLPAKDFIQNVSTVFSGANAQVVGPAGQQTYIIKGIRPRAAPVDPKGRPLMRCQWMPESGAGRCNSFALRPQQLWEHIVTQHLKVAKNPEGKWDFTQAQPDKHTCRWDGCLKFASSGGESAYTVGMHVKTHLPDASDKSSQRIKHNRTPDAANAKQIESVSWLNTQRDEKNDAAGLPLTSALVLRNLARRLPLVEGHGMEGNSGWVKKIFDPVKEQLFFVMAYNQSLREYMASLTRAIAAGEQLT